MQCGWWGPHGEFVFIWPSRGATGHPSHSLNLLSEHHLSIHPEQWLASVWVHPLRPLALFRGIPLWRLGQANTCAILQYSGASYHVQAKIPCRGMERPGQSCWEGADAVVTSGREGSLISGWAAMAPLPIRLNSTQASQINNTLFLPPPLMPLIHLPSSPTDIITVIITVYQADVYRTKRRPVQELLCSVFFCVRQFMALSWR